MNSRRQADDRHPRRAAGLTAIVHDLDDRPDGLDDGERRERLRPDPVRADLGDVPPGAVHVPPDVLDLERAHARAVGRAQLQRRVLRRDRPLRVLQRGHRRRRRLHSTTARRARRRRRGLLQRGFSLLVPIGGASAPTTTSTGRRTSRSGRGRPNARQDEVPPDVVMFTSPLFNMNAELLAGRLRGRPTADRGGRLRRHLQPLHGRGLRQPAAGLELLPDLHDRDRRARLLEGHGRQGEGTAASGSWAAPASRERPTTFGGNSTAEFGPLLFSFYPNPNPAVRRGRTTSATCSAPTPAPHKRGSSADEGASGRPRHATLPMLPEGDALHRAARRLQVLVGERVAVETPNPRAAVKNIAERLDGKRLESVEAVGKNLFLRFEGGRHAAQPPEDEGTLARAARGPRRRQRPVARAARRRPTRPCSGTARCSS